MSEDDRFVLMAKYNHWMNRSIYKACGSLTEHELRLDRGAFFHSIFHTLNHIVYGDLAFMSRFTGDPAEVPELGEELADNYADLAAKRERLDVRILEWTSELDPEWLASELTYQSKVDGRYRTVPQWVLVTHMFNHQTHHRGQVTTLLSQLDIDFGSTDIPFMPDFMAD